jgi:hypothetical protein
MTDFISKQETFNLVYRGLAAQGFQQSKAPVNAVMFVCAYRGIEGRKCAVGLIITDQEYGPDMECLPVATLWDRGLSSLMPHDRFLLRDLQNAHDIGENPDMMKALLQAVAAKHDLTVPEGEQ